MTSQKNNLSLFQRFIREPLLHFLLIGFLLFVLFKAVNTNGADERTIVVNEAVVTDLTRQFSAAWQRAPTQTELQGLIDKWLQDEIAYREGVSMGLDKDDAVIKQRVKRKMDVLAEELNNTPFTDADLEAWLKAHPEKYALPAAFAFEQVMIDPNKVNPNELDAQLNRVKTGLAAGAPASEFSQSIMLPTQVKLTPLDLIKQQFGPEFTSALLQISKDAQGQWQGPIPTDFGLNFIKVIERQEGTQPSLDKVRDEVVRDVESDRRAQASVKYYADLRQQFDIRIMDLSKIDVQAIAAAMASANKKSSEVKP